MIQLTAPTALLALLRGRLMLAGLALGVVSTLAQGFGAAISPPRFEVTVTPGQTKREVIDIHQAGAQSGSFRVYTNDWSFKANGELVFSNDLTAGSCRPWVALEKREITVAANAHYRYRFEISPPADAQAGECRFAVMVEGVDSSRIQQGDVNIPVGGRIAVIVYAAIGDGQARLEVSAKRVITVNGQTVPAIEVRNSGNAHGRLDGFLDGLDATGQKFELAPSDVPIMPGETRMVAIVPVSQTAKVAPIIKFPLKVKGTLEAAKNRIALEHSFAP